MDPASPEPPQHIQAMFEKMMAAIAGVRSSIDDLRADCSESISDVRAGVGQLQERVEFTEARLESLENRSMDIDLRAIQNEARLDAHESDCSAAAAAATPDAVPAAILNRLVAVEERQSTLTQENERLRALLTARDFTTTPSSSSSSPRMSVSESTDPASADQVTQLNNTIIDLTSRLNVLTSELREEERKRDALEANSRLYNLEISGLPVQNPTNDDPMSLARQVVNKVTNGSVRGDEVDVAHRKLGGPKNIILRFRSRTARDRVYAAKKNLKNMSRTNFGYATDGDIFVNESLTFDRSSLMRDVRAKVKSFNGGKVGAARCKLLTDRGVIKVKPPHQKYQKIFCISDLECLL